jgi:hypothetical protein
MLDLAASRVLELGIGDVLNLDFSGLGVDDATIFAHDKILQGCGQNYCEPFPLAAKASSKTDRAVRAWRSLVDGSTCFDL